MKLKRFVIFMLISVMIFSSFTLAVNAADDTSADTAEITLISLDGATAVTTANVGDTITVYSYLNTGSIDGGRISGVIGEQYFTTSVLDYSKEAFIIDDEIVPISEDETFPVTGTNTLCNPTKGVFYFAASTPNKAAPFVFDNDSCKLVVTKYKVIAGGQATVETRLRSLALADDRLTKVINKGELVDGYSINSFSLFEDTCIKGCIITLKDEIGIKFYMYIPKYFDSDKTVTLTWGDENYNYQRTVTDELTPTSRYGSNYLASCYVAARCMTDKVHMSVTSNDREILSYDYSIADYAEDVAEYYSDRDDLKSLMCYMLEYGASVQRNFSYKTNSEDFDVADAYIGKIYNNWNDRKAEAPEALTDDDTDINDIDLSDFGLSYEGTTLTATSETSIRLFFTVTDSEKFAASTASRNGKALPFTDYQGGKKKYISIDSISAKNIFDAYTIDLTNGTDSESIVYSAKDYYNQVLSGDNYNSKIKTVVKAMYNYSASAKGVLS